MSGYQLCQVKKAARPYYIESVSMNIYTIEELCFYLQQNIYLIDRTIINERLCDWIRDELGLSKLYRKLYEQLDKNEGIGSFILPIFKEAGFLSHVEFRELQEEIRKIEIQPEDIRRKMKADYLVNFKMYGNAIHEYYQILQERNPGNMGIQFYSSVLHNMAVAYGRLFLFEEAADCLWKSYGIVRSNETYQKYLMLLPFFMPEEQYRKRLAELRVPKEQMEKIEAGVRETWKEVPEITGEAEEMRQIAEGWKRDYLKGTRA